MVVIPVVVLGVILAVMFWCCWVVRGFVFPRVVSAFGAGSPARLL